MESSTTLRQKVIAVLSQCGEALSYRDLTNAIWEAFPDLLTHFLNKYESEQGARRELRIRLGLLVRNSPGVFTATMSESRILVGLAASDIEVIEEAEEEEDEEPGGIRPSVYWYTFPAYRKTDGPFPIKVGKGNSALTRIGQQVTAMPEAPVILGTFEHADAHTLERALHAVLTLRGRRKQDAPGAEWFVTTPAEIETLITTVLGT